MPSEPAQTEPRPAPHPRNPITGAADAVIGLQWGDEGKGKVIDAMASGYGAVVRFNGGANAGHSVVIDGTRHALHLIPCGIFRPDSLAVIGGGVVVDPLSLIDEIDTLEKNGVSTANLVLSDRAHVVLPWHKVEDAARESAGASRDDEADHSIGTTRRGIGPAYADKATRSTALRVADLIDPIRRRAALERMTPIKSTLLRALDHGQITIDAQAIDEALDDAGRRLAPHVDDTVYLLHDLLRSGRSVLFEGANATLLDVDHGTYPYVTSSSTTALGIPSGSGVPGSALGEIVGVLKAYSTRVGAGPFPTELADATGDRIRERGREFGTTTGRPRRCGWLDLVAARYAAMINGATSLAITLLDVLAGFDTLNVCTSYEVAGHRSDRFLPDATALASVAPVYESRPGFADEITGARSIEDLPREARAYLDFIEEFVGVPIRLIGVGPDREQVIRTGG